MRLSIVRKTRIPQLHTARIKSRDLIRVMERQYFGIPLPLSLPLEGNTRSRNYVKSFHPEKW